MSTIPGTCSPENSTEKLTLRTYFKPTEGNLLGVTKIRLSGKDRGKQTKPNEETDSENIFDKLKKNNIE